MKKKILICGGTGFIGRNLVERFAKNADCDVTATHFNREAPVVPGVNWVRVDLRDAGAVKSVLSGKEVVIQAAATTSGSKDIVTKPFIHTTDNAVMNSLIFREAHEQNVGHVVFFSCTVMYQPNELPLKETDFDANQALFPNYFGVGWTKVYLEKMSEFYSRLGRTRYTVLRHSNIFGPHDKYDLEKSHVFGATVTKVMTANDGRVVVWGTGEEARDVLYVDDLCDAVEAGLNNQRTPFELLNIGYGTAFQIKSLVAAIVKASGRDLKIEHDLQKPTIKTTVCLNCDLAEKQIGWKRKTNLEDGIRKTISWYKENILGEKRKSQNLNSDLTV